MNKQVKKKWLEALRSGEYIQGQDYLVSVNSNGTEEFCCLGVLCDLHAEETDQYWKADDRFDARCLCYSGSERQLLPEEVQEWAGLDRDPGFDDSKGRSHELTDLNDEGKTFKQLANIIEKHF